MEKFPLSTSGLQDLTNELYALSDPALQQQADDIGTDFTSWIVEHFILTESQVTYLREIDQRFIETAASECKYFLQNRLPIHLVKEESSSQRGEQEGEDRGKLLDLDKKAAASFSPDGGFGSSESSHLPSPIHR
jgi:hypothetical protein